LALTTAFLGYRFIKRGLTRFTLPNQIPPTYLGGKRQLHGIVTSVGDGDNFRFLHLPWLYHLVHYKHVPRKHHYSATSIKPRKTLKGQTLHIRLAGVDAPECSHFGSEEQPYGTEALKWLRRLLIGRYMTIVPYSADRYERIVAMAYVHGGIMARWWPRMLPFGISIPLVHTTKNVSVEILSAGLATVYKGQGAEYGNMLGRLEELEARAKSKRVGMWSQKAKLYQSPMAFKKELK
ncbi:staphylococcal nuclease, partial [Ramicandelaber brevisporus]